MTELKKGDRVRVTFEAEYGAATSIGLRINNDMGYIPVRGANPVDNLVIEKIGPPVETFGPGDFVRVSEGDDDTVRLILKDGWVNLTTKKFYKGCVYDFTSEDYERVTYCEPPL